MKWRKLGHIYKPPGTLPWSLSHAANPVAEFLGGDLYRIYFSTRNNLHQSSIGYIVVDLNRPTLVIEVSEEPVLMPGEIGMPDDSGVSIGCILALNGRCFLYYMGWNLSVTVPWRNTIGLAIRREDQKEFQRYSRFPIINLDETDPYTISYPWVMIENGFYRMWYGSNLKWGSEKTDMLHVIKYAESRDGIHWQRPNTVCIPPKDPQEYAICRPCILRDRDTYKMWYCHRGESYRIGYSESSDGVNWNRLDHLSGIDVSQDGWDSEMIEYPFVFDHKGSRYMLYAGNGFGRTGFGICVLDHE
ncbi:MAG: hypothetical protein C4576_20305 [Desulfobacteraceae bacterium]|nr:MAG: hypothetical protein C4576_20305 [Desulfobacteraceae bacterium]